MKKLRSEKLRADISFPTSDPAKEKRRVSTVVVYTFFFPEALWSGPKKQPKHKVFGRDIPGTSGTQTSGYPGQKLYASGLFLLF